MNRQANAPSGPAFLRTHPTSGDRIATLEAEMPAVLPIYEAARRGAVDPNRPIGVRP